MDLSRNLREEISAQLSYTRTSGARYLTAERHLELA
jgi:hypothetical protein